MLMHIYMCSSSSIVFTVSDNDWKTGDQLSNNIVLCLPVKNELLDINQNYVNQTNASCRIFS